MREDVKGDQIGRVLKIYSKLSEGYVVNKAEEAELYGVNERSIQRDIDHIRNFLDEDSERTGIVNTIVYDWIAKGYKLETLYQIRLQNSEVLALCKILLDSRAFTKTEMVEMLDKLITCGSRRLWHIYTMTALYRLRPSIRKHRTPRSVFFSQKESNRAAQKAYLVTTGYNRNIIRFYKGKKLQEANG